MGKKYNLKHILIGIILGIAAVNTVAIAFLSSSVSDSLAKAAELNRPAKLSAVLIQEADCESCFDIDAAFEKIKNTNVLIEDEKRLQADSTEAQALISKYDIKNLPTIIFTGEIKKDSQIEKAWEGVGEIRDDTVIFTKLTPPYFSVSENRVVGKVSVTYLNDKSCADCVIYESFASQLKNSGVIIADEKTVDYRSAEGKGLINNYDIATVPTIIFDKEFGLYEASKNWSQFGKVTNDGSFLATQRNAPYRDLAESRVKGLVTAIHLVDASCSECFDTASIKKILSNFGVAYANERTVDISSSEGASLLKKYQIKKVPMMILDKEADAYPALKKVWNQVGTIESDGSFVVRVLSIVKGGKYKDLTTDTITSN